MKAEIFITFLFYLWIFTKSITNVQDENEKVIMNIYYSKETNFTTVISKTLDENAIAYAIYNKSYERTGWDFLHISTYDKNDSKYNDADKAYAMGYLEGVLTKDRIYSYINNIIHYSCSNNNLKIPDIYKEIVKKKHKLYERKVFKK